MHDAACVHNAHACSLAQNTSRTLKVNIETPSHVSADNWWSVEFLELAPKVKRAFAAYNENSFRIKVDGIAAEMRGGGKPQAVSPQPQQAQQQPQQAQQQQQQPQLMLPCCRCQKRAAPYSKQRGAVAEVCYDEYCPECMSATVSDAIRADAVMGGIKCPVCRKTIADSHVKSLVTNQLVSELETAQVNGFLREAGMKEISCPKCKEKYTVDDKEFHLGVDQAITEKDNDGITLSPVAYKHFRRYNYKSNCGTVFCSLCNTTPYHKGFTCEDYQAYLIAPKCRFCEKTIRPNRPNYVSICKDAADKMKRAHTDLQAKLPPQGQPRELLTAPEVERLLPHDIGTLPLPVSPPPKVLENVCGDRDCVARARFACHKTLACGCACPGVLGELECPPCLQHGAQGDVREELCVLCFTEPLKAAPIIKSGCSSLPPQSGTDSKRSQLRMPALLAEFPDSETCNHMFHFHCTMQMLRTTPGIDGMTMLSKGDPAVSAAAVALVSEEGREDGKPRMEPGDEAAARLSFEKRVCSTCRLPIFHQRLLLPLLEVISLEQRIQTMALERLVYESMDKDEILLNDSSPWYKKPLEYAMHSFVFQQCFKCKQPYFAGGYECNDPAAGTVKVKDLLCATCQPSSLGECKVHSKEFLLYKCRYCCQPSSWSCWGNTHFCNDCHKSGVWQNLAVHRTGANKQRIWDYPQCAALTSKITKLRQDPKFAAASEEEQNAQLAKLEADPQQCPLKRPHPPNGIEYALGCVMCDSSIAPGAGGAAGAPAIAGSGSALANAAVAAASPVCEAGSAGGVRTLVPHVGGDEVSPFRHMINRALQTPLCSLSKQSKAAGLWSFVELMLSLEKLCSTATATVVPSGHAVNCTLTRFEAPHIPSNVAIMRSQTEPDKGAWVIKFRPDHDFDRNGFFYFLGTCAYTQPWVNPALRGLVTVTSSSRPADSLQPWGALNRTPGRCVTQSKPDSFFEFDLHLACLLVQAFTMRHYTSWDGECLRSWNLEGRSKETDNWDVIVSHKNDTSISGMSTSKTWVLPSRGESSPQLPFTFHEAAKRPHRFIRVFQTGPNSFNNHFLPLAGFELYGQLVLPTLKDLFRQASKVDVEVGNALVLPAPASVLNLSSNIHLSTGNIATTASTEAKDQRASGQRNANGDVVVGQLKRVAVSMGKASIGVDELNNLLKSSFYEEETSKPLLEPVKLHKFQSPFNASGVLCYLGSRGFLNRDMKTNLQTPANPVDLGIVSLLCSQLAADSKASLSQLAALAANENATNTTVTITPTGPINTNVLSSIGSNSGEYPWVMIDLGQLRLMPTGFAVRQPEGVGLTCFVFEVNSGSDPLNLQAWKPLRHWQANTELSMDQSAKAANELKGVAGTTPLRPYEAYFNLLDDLQSSSSGAESSGPSTSPVRFLRLRMTGKNAAKSTAMVLSGFEVFGTLCYSLDVPSTQHLLRASQRDKLLESLTPIKTAIRGESPYSPPPLDWFRVFQHPGSLGASSLSVSSLTDSGWAVGVTHPAGPMANGRLPEKLSEALLKHIPTLTQRYFTHTKDFDTKGLFYFLGTQGGTVEWSNPAGNPFDYAPGVRPPTRAPSPWYVEAFSSELAVSPVPSQTAAAICGRETVRCVTRSTKQTAYFGVDLGPYNRFVPETYTMRHYVSHVTECVRSWQMLGSLNGVSWTVLVTHRKDTSINGKGATATWTIDRYKSEVSDIDSTSKAASITSQGVALKEGFRFIAIHQIGPNSNKNTFFPLSGLELYGKLLSAQVPLSPLPFPCAGTGASASDYNLLTMPIKEVEDPCDTRAVPLMSEAAITELTRSLETVKLPTETVKFPDIDSAWVEARKQDGVSFMGPRPSESKANVRASWPVECSFKPEHENMPFGPGGAVYFIGTGYGDPSSSTARYINPVLTGRMNVASSEMSTRDCIPAYGTLSRTPLRCLTAPAESSDKPCFFAWDLGLWVQPTHYALRHYSSFDTEALQSWDLLGSDDNMHWRVLSRHKNDTKLDTRGKAVVWKLDPKVCANGDGKTFAARYFKLVQTGLNSNDHEYIALSGFEVFGTVYAENVNAH